jgi:hypothetical protein
MTDDPWEGIVDRDPQRGHRDVPIDLERLHGERFTIEDMPTTVVVVPALHRMAAWLTREKARMLAMYRAGNVSIWSAPTERGGRAVVQVTDVEGQQSFEEIRYPTFVALTEAQRGDTDA